MMSLTKDDRDVVELIATKVAEKFGEAQARSMEMMLNHHQETCPHGRQLLESKWVLIGIGFALVLLTTGSSALGGLLLKILGG